MPLRGQERVGHPGHGLGLGRNRAPSARHTLAPCWTHRVRTSTSAGLRRLPAFLGGIRSVSSSSAIRAIRALESGSPGTIAVSPLFSGLIAVARWSSRRPLARLASSEPWQAKQFLDRIGRTSRLKSTGREVAGFVPGGSTAEVVLGASAKKPPSKSDTSGMILTGAQGRSHRFGSRPQLENILRPGQPGASLRQVHPVQSAHGYLLFWRERPGLLKGSTRESSLGDLGKANPPGCQPQGIGFDRRPSWRV